MSTCGACLRKYDLARQSQVCPHDKRVKPTQTERLVGFIRSHPGASIMEIVLGLDPFVSNPRARISDARAAGHLIDCIRRSDGRLGYVLREGQPAPLSGTQTRLAL